MKFTNLEPSGQALITFVADEPGSATAPAVKMLSSIPANPSIDVRFACFAMKFCPPVPARRVSAAGRTMVTPVYGCKSRLGLTCELHLIEGKLSACWLEGGSNEAYIRSELSP
ncbi:MAG: hypothetical protein U5Q16_08645 [Gammaproteobacteria bacterium]|nr:hypothetical protein [Gammaproteobacteria bacterium]